MTYLDHAATTPILPEAARAMTAELGLVGNPSSLHAPGRRARRVVEEARESLASSFGARPSEIVFTGGGTESDNLAIKGLFWSRRDSDPRRRRILASAVEHHAVIDPVQWLVDHEGALVTWLSVDEAGRVDPSQLRAEIEQDPDSIALVSIMWANNEVGTVQPISECAAIATEFDVPFHTDAVQAAGHLPIDFETSGSDALTLTSHKLGGPLGVGALLLSRSTTPVPLQHGGGQERDVRSGTLDTPAIVGFAVAAEIAVREISTRSAHVASLRDDLLKRLLEEIPDAIVNGDTRLSGKFRLPGNAHVSFPGCEGDSLLMLLDARGIACSTGSACSAGVAQASHVLLAMGASPAIARSSLRFSLGHTSTEQDVSALISVIEPVVARARAAGAATHVGR
ncbi:MAG TPA: cysteine desulfurase family protein [Actinomycetes bacterium]|nr:cysteine desulfurase family protein [Actinomycetes bacterium]